MKSSRVFASLICLVFSSLTLDGILQAQQGMISAVHADRAGLVIQWFAQLDTTDAQTVVDLQLVIDENRATTYFQIAGGGLRKILSEHDIAPNGLPYGVEGAREFAEIHKEIFEAKLKRDEKDAEVTIEQFSVPESTLYTISEAGMLNAIDAESGKMRWRIEVGRAGLPIRGMGASKEHLAVLSGSTVICLNAGTGKILWERQLQSAVSGSPALNDKYIFVPMANGSLEILPFDREQYARSIYVAVGTPSSMMSPTIEGGSIAWATNRGVTVAPANKIASLRFRINSESDILATPVSHGGVIFMVSVEGFVYAVDERRGALLWRLPVGERISSKPVPIGNDLFVITDDNNLYRFDAQSGQTVKGWEKPMSGIKQYVGASEQRLYFLDNLGQLLTLDRQSGTRLSTVSGGLSLRTFSNIQSDRLFVCHQSGLIQCLREPGNERPMFHSDDWMKVAQAEPENDLSKPVPGDLPGDTNPDSDTGNPFGGGVSNPAMSDPGDPFGGGATSAPATNDPFGGGSTPPPATSDPGDPFGGGSTTPPPSSNSSDPFGGGASTTSHSPAAGVASNDPFSGGGMLPSATTGNSASITSSVSAWNDVSGIMKQQCGTCHNARGKKGGLDVSTYASLMEGGSSGEAIVAGDPDKSRLYLLVTHADEPAMPPGDDKKLSDSDIAKIKTWIMDGALETAASGTAAPGAPAAGGSDSSDPFGG